MTNNPLNLDESPEWAGLWWLPEEPDKRVPSTLRYDGEGHVMLPIIGAFEDRITSSPAPSLTLYHEGTRMWDVIHGVAEQREITLLGCVPTKGKRSIFSRVKGPDTQTITAMIAIIGAHISGEDDAAFATAEVSIEDLWLWAASPVFEAFLNTSKGKIDGSWALSSKPVEEQLVTVDGTEYSLAHTQILPFFAQCKSGS
ncbi:hypothetical protein [Alloscardovia omnicolens]|uniref:ApeA N-terminal domain-containing protein n=1 Tax=Alloscardovia omnicolens F0580 TaxID=1321816 RepID=U1R9Q5_9BIFI|nr:hypothetical protein [Alloscardovia omnicolens]ERH30756.1 hypothetical protein HMPREF9244_00954 [Alloscardovia omnicolens F0580]